MGNTDSIPIISQTKSLVQAIAGDTEGAKRTQENFVKGCPGISQVAAAGAAIAGNTEYAQESQKYFVNNLSSMVDSIPVVGHVKGGIHYAVGDTEGGDNAMKASSRSVGVIGGGIGGFFVGGPVGSVAGGIAGGVAMDGLITGVESGIRGKYTPSGHIDFATRAINGELGAGDYFDWAEGFHGEVPSAQQILDQRFPGGAPRIRGMGPTTTAEGSTAEPSCAEIQAVHEHHRANGLSSTPSRTIAMSYDPATKTVSAIVRCNNCKKIGWYGAWRRCPRTPSTEPCSIPRRERSGRQLLCWLRANVRRRTSRRRRRMSSKIDDDTGLNVG